MGWAAAGTRLCLVFQRKGDMPTTNCLMPLDSEHFIHSHGSTRVHQTCVVRQPKVWIYGSTNTLDAASARTRWRVSSRALPRAGKFSLSILTSTSKEADSD